MITKEDARNWQLANGYVDEQHEQECEMLADFANFCLQRDDDLPQIMRNEVSF